MAHKMNLWLAAGAQDLPRAAALRLPMVWLIYRVSDRGALQRAQLHGLPAGVGGPARGLLGLTGALPAAADPAQLARSLATECGKRGFSGVLLDLEADGGGTAALSALLTRQGLPCFMPLSLSGSRAPAGDGAGVSLLIPSALSGGSYSEMLATAAARYGPPLGLELVRMCHDFRMPAYPPQGTPLTAAQLRALIEIHRPTPYFSPQMGCRYFSYPGEDGAHFVLFDDVASARGKLTEARDRGYTDGFILYREWGDSAAGLFRRLARERQM